MKDEALVVALVEIDQYVGTSGWDQPARLFALVPTLDLIAAEPTLARHIKASSRDALSSIEQEDFHAGTDLAETLAGISWPPAVVGCALVAERSFVPASQESRLPADPAVAARYVADHPLRQDLRVIVGVTRSGARHGLGRLRNHPEDLLTAPDLVPGLAAALAHTLLDHDENEEGMMA